MIKTIISVCLTALILCPLTGRAEEPVPPEGFLEITEGVLDTFEVLEGNARKGDFNQLRNSEIRVRFDEIRAGLIQYEGYVMDSVYNWPEGQQREIASELHTVHFLYRAYSLSEYNDFRRKAEESLQKARELYRNYVRHVKARKEM